MTIRPVVITGEPVLHQRAAAVEVIDEADKKVQGMVNSLSDVFSRIY